MDERPRFKLGSPIPSTPPKKRGGAYESLLALFGSMSSATSATKARRESSLTEAKPTQPVDKPTESKQTVRLDNRPNRAPLIRSRSPSAESSTTKSSLAHEGTDSAADNTSSEESEESSEDEPAAPVRRARTLQSRHHLGELKMEARKKDPTPRRSARNRPSDILASDTVAPTPPRAVPRRIQQPRRLGTARARLRDDIAQKTKAKANNFFVANQDRFLPLLPEHNYVSRLVSKQQVGPIVEYESLKQQPEGVTATMKPYQLEGLSFLVHLHNNGFSGILGDEMGLGKTLQTLSLFQYLEEKDRESGTTSEELRPYLVVCPLSVLNSWVSEAQKWVPELKVLRYHGNPKERDRLKRVALGLEDQRGNETTQARQRKASKKAGVKVTKLPTEETSNSFKIVVTTYETFQAEKAWFGHSFIWRYVVLDEGHKIKSSATQISTSLKNVSSEYRLILTGTPLQNNLVEMWALLAWLYPDVFTENTQSLFKESFDLSRGKINRKTLDDARSLLELIMLRRMKDSPSVNLGLPEKEEVLLFTPLTPLQRLWYTRLLTRMDDTVLDELFVDSKSKEKAALEEDKHDEQLQARLEHLEAGDDEKDDQWEKTAEMMRQAIKKEQEQQAAGPSKSAWQKLMNLVMQLRKCCSHPYLIPGARPEPYAVGQHVIRASGKFILLEKLLRNSIFMQGKKVLIFSGFTTTLDYCEDLLSILSNFGQEFKYLRLDGSSQRARRNLDIRLFNDAKSDYKVMLLSTRAGGLGINLTTAEDIVFLDEDWNPQITLQAEARAHRIGQSKKVTVYKLCTQGTVEEQMMGRIRKKLYLSTKITESMKSVHGDQASAGRASLEEDAPEMSTNQLKSLIRRGAQTLSHPDIDVTDMLSWDLDKMMEKCRDKAADPLVNPDVTAAEVDEEKWLSTMERVECAVLDGKRYQRNRGKVEKATDHILPESISRQDRRKGKNTTVMIDGFAINKESLHCGDWEAVPTMAGKDPRLADVKREKRREFQHEGHCLGCFDGADSGHLIGCKSCPRAYHFDCLEPEFQEKVKGFNGFFCSQHVCCECGKNTTDAGGLIYRCRWCPRAYCEDCLATAGTEELVGENLPEFDMMGEGPTATGFYIKCPECVGAVAEDEERLEWMRGMELSYNEQHDEWIKMKEEEQRQIEEMQDAAAAQEVARRENSLNVNGSRKLHLPQQLLDEFNSKRSIPVIDLSSDLDDDSGASPPALTDNSFATPITGESGFSTPRRMHDPYRPPGSGKKRADAGFGDTDGYRAKKRTKVEQHAYAWQKEDTADPYNGWAFGN
ncbi:ISWI chromatin-remodeling complex ATPase-like protein ISW2 [Byssothecium circinans]|uniref:ISWI chromatin-remodeling complex ATPase-like protein ISW2 n=1 Tax=Byssothecium circinans TaxID=147558 RepID=A0A6A5T9G2_9PLEO|nr:ISWI chromatin-remodeling complex ATPase-like protein ISW2 [Byssothecium circinans]KAF1950867.1 ISWI chromatin-remodeling complex ATPase-like protein ISW2 [Byssothecium circinans]